MYCATCGTEIKPELNYCNRCGARVDKLATTEGNSTVLQNLSMATGFVGLGGLGLTVGLIALLLKSGVVIEAVVMLALAFLVTVFGMTFCCFDKSRKFLMFCRRRKRKVFRGKTAVKCAEHGAARRTALVRGKRNGKYNQNA